jgi:hypothetical protein
LLESVKETPLVSVSQELDLIASVKTSTKVVSWLLTNIRQNSVTPTINGDTNHPMPGTQLHKVDVANFVRLRDAKD